MRDFFRRSYSFFQRNTRRGEVATTVTIVILGILLGGGILANQLIETGTRLFSRAQVAGVPNCKDIDGPVTLFINEPAVFQATFSSPSTNLVGGFFLDGVANIPLNSPKQFAQQFFNYSGGNVGAALQWTWTPTANDVGGHTVYCRAINGVVAECRPPGMLDPAPGNQYACAGPAMFGQPATVKGRPIYVAPSRSVIPNCSINSISPTTITAGQQVTINVRFDSQQGELRGRLYVDNDAGQIFDRFYGSGTTVTTATENITWTPTAANVGPHTIYCRAWYDGIAECRPSNLVDKNPRFPCAGPNASQTFTVVAAPTPTKTVDQCPTYCNQTYPGSTASCAVNAGLCPATGPGGGSLQGFPNYCGGTVCCCTAPGPATATPPPAINCSVTLRNATEIDPASASHQFQANVTGGYPPYTYQWRIYDGKGITVDQVPYQTNSIYTWNLQSKPFTPGSIYIFAYVDIKDSKGSTKTNCTPAAPQVRGASQLCAPCTSSTYCTSLDPSGISYCSGGRCSPVVGAWCPVAPAAPSNTPVPPAATNTPVPPTATPTSIPVQCGQACTQNANCPAGTLCSTATSKCQAQAGYVCAAATNTPVPRTATPIPTNTLVPVQPGSCAPPPVTFIQPLPGTVTAGTPYAIQWNQATGANDYAIRIDKASPSWAANITSCTQANPEDACTDGFQGGTSFNYTFDAGVNYDIWVHAKKTGCIDWSPATHVTVTGQTAQAPTPTTDPNATPPVGGGPTNTPVPPTPTRVPGTFICKYDGQIPTDPTTLLACGEQNLDQDLTLFLGCLQDFLDGKVARCKVRADIDANVSGTIDQGDITAKLKVWSAGKADHIKTRLTIKYR